MHNALWIAPWTSFGTLSACKPAPIDSGATPGCTTCETVPSLPSPTDGGTTTAVGSLWPGGSTAWTYRSPGPQWVRLDAFGDPGTALTMALDQGNGEPWAASDGFPGGGLASGDVGLVAWLPRADNWLVTLTDGGDPVDTGGIDPFTVSLSVHLFAGGVVEGETADVGPVVTIVNGSTGATVGAVLDATGDVDSVSVDLAAGGQPLEVYGWAEAPGSELRSRLHLVQGGLIVGSLDDVAGDRALSVFDPAAGAWTLQVTDQLGGGGVEMWGAFLIRTWDAGDDHPVFGALPWTTEVEPNDDTPTTSPELQDGYAVWQVQGTLASDTDVDAFEVIVDAGETVSARCWGSDQGSAVDLEVDVEVAGTNVTPLGQGLLPTSQGYYVYNVVVDPGPVTILLANDALVGGPSAYYRCRFVAATDLLGVGDLP